MVDGSSRYLDLHILWQPAAKRLWTSMEPSSIFLVLKTTELGSILTNIHKKTIVVFNTKKIDDGSIEVQSRLAAGGHKIWRSK
jgi:hypothetical protein